MSTNIVIGQMIRYYLKKNNMTMKQLGNLLGKTESTVSKWVSGTTTPLAKDIAEMTQIFSTDIESLMYGKEKDSLTSLINVSLAALSEKGKRNVFEFSKSELLKERHNKSKEQSNVISHDFSVKKIVNDYENDGTEDVDISGTVAAGFGSFNEDKSQPIKTVTMNENDVPHHYDLVFEVSGDSMYPTFEDREIIFVKKTTEVTNGMIGCVEINGYAFIKKMYVEDGRLRLCSLNNDYDEHDNRLYPDFYADETDNVFVIGKVIN